MSRAHIPLALTALTVLGVSACSAGSGSAVSAGNPAACAGDVVDVVVSVGQWGDLARRLGGDCATVTTIVSSGNVDPHDFEPGTADLAAFASADLVVVNGMHYDEWAEDAVATLDSKPTVLSAAEVAGVTDGSDPHLWVDPAIVPEVAIAITAALSELSPGAAEDFQQAQIAWTADLQRYLDAVAALQAEATGRTYVATEGVFDRLAGAVGLIDGTPAGFRRAAGNGSDPSPGDLAAFEAALVDGTADVLIYNTQTSGGVPEQLRAVAEQAGVPVVEVTESPADAGGSFLAWQLAQVQQLADALRRTA